MRNEKLTQFVTDVCSFLNLEEPAIIVCERIPERGNASAFFDPFYLNRLMVISNLPEDEMEWKREVFHELYMKLYFETPFPENEQLLGNEVFFFLEFFVSENVKQIMNEEEEANYERTF